MKSIDKIPESAIVPQVIYAPTIKPRKNTNALVNGVLVITGITIFLAMLATYFVSLGFDGNVSLKDYSINCAWLIVGSFFIGTITKKIAANKGRQDEGYVAARKEAGEKLKALRADNLAPKIAEYCREYELSARDETRQTICKNYNVDFKKYAEKYDGNTIREIKRKYPNEVLLKAQKKGIRKANKVRIHKYNPDFLRWEEAEKSYHSPSEAYRSDVNNTLNSLWSLVSNIVSSLFACSIGVELFTNFSRQAVIMALIKVIFIVINVANKFMFGWNNTVITECNQYKLKASEADSFRDWCKEKVEADNSEASV